MKLSTFVLLAPLTFSSFANAEDEYAILVKTAEPEIAYTMVQMFHSMAQLDELEEGAHHVILVDNLGEVTIIAGQGDVGLLRLRANPSALLKIFDKEIQQGQAMAQMMVGMSAPPGTNTQGLTKLIGSIFQFPKQIDSLAIAVDGNPEENHVSATIDLQPKESTPLASFVSAMNPNQSGAPIGTRGALASLAFAIDAASMPGVMDPLNTLLGPLGVNTAQFSKWYRYFDGTFSLTLDGDGTTQFVAGTGATDDLREFLYGDGYSAYLDSVYSENDMVSMEYSPSALVHRDVALHKTELTAEDPAMAENPLMPGGHSVQYIGLAGKYLVGLLVGGNEAKAKGLIDQAVDDKFTRTRIADGAIFALDISIAELAGMRGAPPEALEEVPNRAHVTLGRKDSALRIGINVE